MFSNTTIQLLGYEISNNKIRPDPLHLQPLHDLPLPTAIKLQKKVVGLFSYYSRWIQNLSAKVRPLSNNVTFPVPAPVLDAFNKLKLDIEESVVTAVD